MKAAQLTEVTALQLAATPATVNETATHQLSGAQLLDDLTTNAVPAASITWSVEMGSTPISPPSGPIHWLFQGPPAESKVLAAIPSLVPEPPTISPVSDKPQWLLRAPHIQSKFLAAMETNSRSRIKKRTVIWAALLLTLIPLGEAPAQLEAKAFQRNSNLEIQLDFSDAEPGIAADYAVEYSIALNPAAWTGIPAIVTSTGGQAWRATASLPQAESRAFFRITKNGIPLTAALQGGLTTLEEGEDNPGVTVLFNRAFTGTLFYEIDTLDGGDPQVGSISVNGATSARIPLPSVAPDDGEANPDSSMTVRLRTSGGGEYVLGGLEAITLDLIDNDSIWEGLLEEGSAGTAFEFRMVKQGGATTAQFAGKGTNVFPAMMYPVSGFTFEPGGTFSATVSPILVPASETPLSEDTMLTLALTATDTPDPADDLTVLGDLITGSYTLTQAVTNKPFLNHTRSGTFRLLRRTIVTAE